jgi:hypothetical protein
VRFEVMLCRVLGMFRGVYLMPVSDLGVMGCALMVADFMVLRCFRMVVGSHPVMVRCLAVFVCCLIGHDGSSGPRVWPPAGLLVIMEPPLPEQVTEDSIESEYALNGGLHSGSTSRPTLFISNSALLVCTMPGLSR